MGPIYSFGDFLDMVRRRLSAILRVFVLGCLVSLWFAASQQHEYETAEVLQITQPQIAGELAKSTVEGSSARRMQLIEQRLMARGTVLEIIEKFGLYADRALADAAAEGGDAAPFCAHHRCCCRPRGFLG